ncbi:hypothetical protein K7711_18820 [Nocardia sp. CA2R105]|uniref:hypothetical protein n=1 Tax=Nocardia coffeae TaxID=2873381 RepID=UPI001CA61D17|nr:hypothetical protein [Nocardia coffeae]MBY8858540.1 hypothetical protein [Nocardia coffeae]
MNYELLFPEQGAAPVRYALTGANGGFARSLLMQTRAMPALAPVALGDLDPDGRRTTCIERGYPDAELITCHTPDEVRAAAGPGTAPYYLAAGARLTTDVPAGTVLTLDHLDTDARSRRDAWQKGATA